MLLFKQLMSLNSSQTVNDDNTRCQHLIQAISIEFLILNFFLIGLSAYLHINFISYLLVTNTLLIALTLVLLKKKENLRLCGHLVNILCFVMITVANLWFGSSASSSTLDWFYISPILATVTIGINGLLIYGSLAGITLLALLSIPLPTFYNLSANALNVLAHVNPLFIFLLMCTILYTLLVENKLYEALLKEQNFLLTADKQKFHYLSHHDSLTNLPNRSYFHTYLQELMDTVDGHHTAISLYFMDLDDFKIINDRYGHEAGDMLLLQAGKRLQSCFRDSDFIARLGGDEFTAIITHSPQEKIAEVLTGRIKKEFKKPFLINKLEIICPISIGTANYPSQAKNAETLLKIADERMYKNKKRKAGASLT